MIQYLFPLLLGAGAASAAPFCSSDDPTLLWRSCDGNARLEVKLLPEDVGPTPAKDLDVTGAYTATDQREDGSPKPVGLFIRRGEIVSREYVRFDGVLTVSPTGQPRIHYRRNVQPFDKGVFDLEDSSQRSGLLEQISAARFDILQSHLLIIDGKVDTAAVAGAPAFRRRILFQLGDQKFGLFDSSPRRLTLHEAAIEVAEKFQPTMALNLDMGSYDFCRKGTTECGALSAEATDKLSNIIRFHNSGD